MIKKIAIALLYPFAALAALGLGLSLAVHIAAIMGWKVPQESIILFPGIFVVWFPAVLTASFITRGTPRKDAWKTILRGAPRWMHFMLYGSFLYAIFNLVFFVVVVRGGQDSSDNAIVRTFSGHILPFYAAALAILVSAIRIQKQGPRRRCPNGHAVPFPAIYCERCGQPVSEARD